MSIHAYGKPKQYLNLSNVSVPHWQLGEGPALFFVHGWPLDSRTWRRSVELLSADFTCHLIDLPGAGLSRWNPDTPLGVASFSEVVEEAVKALNLRKVCLIGHDSGGGIARMAAARMPDRVVGMVFGNTETPKRYTPLFRALFASGRLPFSAQLFAILLRFDFTRGLFDLTSDKYYPGLGTELDELFLKPLGTDHGRRAAAVQLLQSASVSDFDALTEAHKQISAPVSFVWGKQDPWFNLEHAKDMLGEFAGETHFLEIEKAGLLVHEERPDLFASAVKELFNQKPVRAA